MMREFMPDYRNIVLAATNRAAPRLPLYEHIIAPVKMEEITGRKFVDLLKGGEADQREYFHQYCGFFREMGYDTVSFECCVCDVIAGGETMAGSRPGAITNREDFERYPFAELPARYWAMHEAKFRILGEELPP
jgi:uroporphyrinogen decarboxylase